MNGDSAVDGIVAHDITLGEVHRMILRFRKDVKDDVKSLFEAINSMGVVGKEQYQSDKAEIQRRLAEVEAQQAWLMRTAIAAVLASVLQLVSLVVAYSMGVVG